MLNSKKGQSIVELLPSMTIFFMLMTASLAYYRMMRAVTLKQEVVRNLTFAKINNSGTITTTANQMKNGSPSNMPQLNLEAEFIRGGAPISGVVTYVISKDNNRFVKAQSNCFIVFPDSPVDTIKLGNVFMTGDLGDINFSTYAVIYRNPGSSCL